MRSLVVWLVDIVAEAVNAAIDAIDWDDRGDEE